MDLRANDALCRQYVEDMADLGEKIAFKEEVPATASTDMGTSFDLTALQANR